ncbi:hypothetical protein [Skermanella stibiiresistens]|uniref:hypothetical protein n=1 Tax=Skermanella stibiiresistens TaxID=913326 RepID=UPI0018DB00A8|nr:hypothetical protein [Skermanella stibiiresistens]
MTSRLLGYDVELWGGGQVSDPPQLDLQTEEAEALIGDLVQPVECCAVLLSKVRGNPDDCYRVETGGIGQKLTEVAVIRAL